MLSKKKKISSFSGVLFNVSGSLKFKCWNQNGVQSVETPDYTWFRCLALDDNNIGYAIAAGPKKSTSVIEVDVNSQKVFFFQC